MLHSTFLGLKLCSVWNQRGEASFHFFGIVVLKLWFNFLRRHHVCWLLKKRGYLINMHPPILFLRFWNNYSIYHSLDPCALQIYICSCMFCESVRMHVFNILAWMLNFHLIASLWLIVRNNFILAEFSPPVWRTLEIWYEFWN